MIWLASFPRSGNTFFRNILYEVYGITSSAYHHDPNIKKDHDFESHPVVKTHLLPSELPAHLQEIKSVYIVRDARDVFLSLAHQRKDLIAPESDFHENLREAILAEEGSYFGGWSENTQQWIAKADVVIYFKDLVADPIKEVEKLRTIMDLPAPDISKLPTFQKLKYGKPKYGAKGKKLAAGENRNLKMFRKGKVGGWKGELTQEYEQLIYIKHGEQMQTLGYKLRDLTSTLKTSTTYESRLLQLKGKIRSVLPPSIYNSMKKLYVILPIRPLLRKLHELLSKH